jgi:ATP-binding cassette subfamily G (WHITE) protein 2 (SNQ2)
MDVHEGTATVFEAMRFSAYLRQPYHVSEAEKDRYVQEIIELLELQDLANALVFSLSPEARKRLTIGVELASKPELLLFLDEPTSGLDAQSAWNLVRFLRKLADQGQAILCTIHQPSSLLFESFDRLLLLEKGGETVYFGDIGRDSVHVRNYFARYGARCPPNTNPAEYMLEVIGAGVTPRIGKRDWKDIWLESPEFQRALKEIADIKKSALALPAPPNGRPQTCQCIALVCCWYFAQIRRRCNTFPVSDQDCRAEEQHCAVEVGGLFVQPIFCPRLHLVVCLAVLPSGGQQCAGSSV